MNSVSECLLFDGFPRKTISYSWEMWHMLYANAHAQIHIYSTFQQFNYILRETEDDGKENNTNLRRVIFWYGSLLTIYWIWKEWNSLLQWRWHVAWGATHMTHNLWKRRERESEISEIDNDYRSDGNFRPTGRNARWTYTCLPLHCAPVGRCEANSEELKTRRKPHCVCTVKPWTRRRFLILS